MSGIVEWVKNYSLVFFLMTILTSMTAKKEYRKYIQLFVEIILVITLISPLLRVSGKSEELFGKISYDSFWQGLAGLKKDQEKVDFLNEGDYISYYERAVEADVKLLAENSGYAVTDVQVDLNEAYEVETMELTVAQDGIEPVIIGTLEPEPEHPQITLLREKVASFYQIEPEKVVILD